MSRFKHNQTGPFSGTNMAWNLIGFHSRAKNGPIINLSCMQALTGHAFEFLHQLEAGTQIIWKTCDMGKRSTSVKRRTESFISR